MTNRLLPEGLVDASYEWMDDAECKKLHAPLDVFFVDVGFDASQARSVCRHCKVKADCLEYAIVNGITHGVWGGMTPRERRKVVRIGRVIPDDTRRRMAWMKTHGWMLKEIAAEFGVTERTVVRALARERRPA